LLLALRNGADAEEMESELTAVLELLAEQAEVVARLAEELSQFKSS
jgi:hypothetical protein